MHAPHDAAASRCPTAVALLSSAWLALLLAAGLNAGWLFSTLIKAGVQFRQGPAVGIDSEETGRILAGILAQPGFVGVFLAGMLAGPACAWMLLRAARRTAGAGRATRLAALAMLAAAAIGAGQLVLARAIAERAVERTEALVSGDEVRATHAREALDRVHRASELAYGGQVVLVALGVLLAVWPRDVRPAANPA
jgi:hypothetical protein